MRKISSSILYSPSDLIVFMESEFASWMDRFQLERPGEVKMDQADPTLEILRRKGFEHEAAYLESLRSSGLDVVEIPDGQESFNATASAMREGRDVIYQAALSNGAFAGRADFLVKVARKSDLGNFHYEVWDTKLSRESKPYFVIQLCCYAEMLEAIQGKLPDCIGIVLGDGSQKRFRTADFFYYYRCLKLAFEESQTNFNIDERPIPNGMDHHGRWNEAAVSILEELDHLSRIANIRRVQIKKLETVGLTALKALATTELTHVSRMEPATFTTLRTQARLQFESQGMSCPKYSVIAHDGLSRRGLALLPPASSNDVFFDMEGYPYIEGGLEYLFGASYQDNGDLQFKAFWAHNRDEEKEAFENFIDWTYQRWLSDQSMHVYHYGDYEISALRRLMGRHGTREKEVDELLRNDVFINLFTVVRQSMFIGAESYSIKKVELLYREKRDSTVSTAMDSVVFYDKWIEERDGDNVESSKLLACIRDYNKDDCDSTAQLAGWLRKVQAENAIAWIPPSGKEPGITAAAQARDEAGRLAQQLLTSLPANEEDARIQRLLAHLLGFHWRESKPIFWAKYDRHEMNDAQLIDEPNCLGGLQRTQRLPQPVKRSLSYEFSFDPSQDTKLEVGSKCFFAHDLRAKTEILQLDQENGLIEIKIGPKQQAPPDNIGLIPDEFVDPQVIADSIFRTISDWQKTNKLPSAIETVLRRQSPAVTGISEGDLIREEHDALAAITHVVANLNDSAICIQGPPGSGKTYTSAKVILHLLMSGKRVGVTSNSHKAIAKLLWEVERGAKKANFKLKGSKLQSDLDDFGMDGSSFAASTSVDYVFGTGRTRFDLIGGTAWTFSEEAAVGGVDYLFVDEAGQVSLANLLGMAPAARNIVLVGDQMQLSQPIKGAHPDESGQSVLEYLLHGRQTVPPDFGIFLSKTYRMRPEICEFISSAVYDNRLLATEDSEKRNLIMPPDYTGLVTASAGVLFVPVSHEGNSQSSPEEVETIARLIKELLDWKLDESGIERQLQPKDILVVAPYNMQVKALKPVHHRDYVGTVDRFQGQEAPVVVVSMCASEGSESARGLEFLFSKNRLNVAISRAQCLSIVVGSPKLTRTECRRLEQIELVNLFCRVAKGK